MTAETFFPATPAVLVPVIGHSTKFPIHRIFCVGRNYMAHAAEMGVTVDKATQEPFYFLKDASCYVPSGACIDYPAQTHNYHHEMELVVAIGKAGFQIQPQDAMQHIFGYACGLDMTRRDVQLKARAAGKPWDLGKNFEQSAILSDIIPNQQSEILTAGTIELSVNGVIKQSANINTLIWNIAEIIADLSSYYHLQAGDLIYTGTPEGVGPVLPGDYLHGHIEGVGEISLTINAASDR